jgi:hypothetical protein
VSGHQGRHLSSSTPPNYMVCGWGIKHEIMKHCQNRPHSGPRRATRTIQPLTNYSGSGRDSRGGYMCPTVRLGPTPPGVGPCGPSPKFNGGAKYALNLTPQKWCNTFFSFFFAKKDRNERWIHLHLRLSNLGRGLGLVLGPYTRGTQTTPKTSLQPNDRLVCDDLKSNARTQP